MAYADTQSIRRKDTIEEHDNVLGLPTLRARLYEWQSCSFHHRLQNARIVKLISIQWKIQQQFPLCIWLFCHLSVGVFMFLLVAVTFPPSLLGSSFEHHMASIEQNQNLSFLDIVCNCYVTRLVAVSFSQSLLDLQHQSPWANFLFHHLLFCHRYYVSRASSCYVSPATSTFPKIFILNVSHSLICGIFVTQIPK